MTESFTSVTIYPTDKPWITSTIKKLIFGWQQAYHSGHFDQWKSLRNRVHHTIYQRKKDFYHEKVQHLKNSNVQKWWNIVNKLVLKSLHGEKKYYIFKLCSYTM